MLPEGCSAPLADSALRCRPRLLASACKTGAASALRLLRRPGAAGGRAWKAARSRGAREWRDGRGLPELLPGLPHDLCFQDPDSPARRHPRQRRAGARDERERAARPAAARGAG